MPWLQRCLRMLFEQKGGLLGAKSARELLHSRDQAYYLKIKLQNKAVSESIGCSIDGRAHDMLYAVMLQCKSTEGSECFVQDVTCAREPMAVYAAD